MKNTFSIFISTFLLISTIKASGYSATTNEIAREKSLNIIHKYEAFMQDYLDFTRKQLAKGHEDYKYNETEIKFHLRKLEKTRNFISSLNINSKSFTDRILRSFLKTRFDMLDYRLDLFRRRELIDDGSERMSEKIACNTTICQFYDELVAEIYDVYITLPNPYADTLRLISLCPNLWPLLKRETREIPDPDQAIYTDSTRRSIRPSSDLDFFLIYEKLSENVFLPTYGLGVPKDQRMNTVIQMTQYERSLFDNGYLLYGKIKEIEIPEWLTTQQGISLEEETAKEQHCEDEKLMNLNSSAAIVAKQEVVVEILEKSCADSIATDIAFGKLKVSDDSDVATTAGKEDTLSIYEALPEEPKPQENLNLGIVESVLAPKISTQLKATPYEKPLPRGLRIFHPYKQKFHTNFKKLSSKHQSTLDDVMEGKAESVSYADFSSLWKAINGEGSIEESSGSSHKVLHDSTGKKVTGIFAHNKGMTYTKRTIPYLYAAIQMLGDERLMGVENVSW